MRQLRSSTDSKQRPVPLNIICGVLVLSLVASVLVLGSVSAADFDGRSWLLIELLLTIVVSGIALLGLLRMKKWGIILYTANMGQSFLIALVAGIGFNIVSLVLPIVIIVVGFLYFNELE